MSGPDDLRERMRSARDAPERTPSEATLAKREAAEELRALLHAIGSSGASPAELRSLTEELRARVRVLTASVAEPDPRDARAGAVVGMGDFHDRSPIVGRANPMAPPATLALDLDAGRVRGEVEFGPGFEGAPGLVHGGLVAAVLDEALGMACVLSGLPGMTVELTTRYRQHTPVGTPLRLEARLVSVDGRKIRTAGEVYHDEVPIVEARGLFIAVDTRKFEDLAAAKSERAPG